MSSVPSGRCARGTVPGFDLHLNLIVERWLCTKTLILVSVERSVQYRERSDRMAHSTNNHQNLGVMLSVPSGRCARGTVHGFDLSESRPIA